MQRRLTYRRLPRVEVVADQLVMALSMTMDLLLQEEGSILIELGQTRPDREALIEQVASSCYQRSGLVSFPRRLMQSIMSEGDLQDLFLLYLHHVPHDQMVEQCTRLLHTHKDIPYAIPQENGPVPEVSRDVCRTPRRTMGIRTRRDPRRTARCDERTMSEDGLPPRV